MPTLDVQQPLNATDSRDRRWNQQATQYKAPPSAGDIRGGYSYDGVVGTFAGEAPDHANPADVRALVVYDYGRKIGVSDHAPPDKVVAATVYDNGSKVGTYAPSVQQPGAIAAELVPYPSAIGAAHA